VSPWAHSAKILTAWSLASTAFNKCQNMAFNLLALADATADAGFKAGLNSSC